VLPRLFLTELLATTQATPLEHTDLWSLHEHESTRYSFDQFQALWDKEVKSAETSGDPSLSKVIL